MVSDVIKVFMQIVISRKAFLLVAIIAICIAYIADPINSRSYQLYFYRRLIIEFRVELIFIMIIAILYEIFGLSKIKKIYSLYSISSYRIRKSITGSVLYITTLSILSISFCSLICSLLYFASLTHTRVQEFPADFEARLRSEIILSFNNHEFQKFRKLYGFYSQYYGNISTEDDLFATNQEVDDRLALSKQLAERASVTMVRGQETYETMERLRSSYAINRNPEIKQRIDAIEHKVRSAVSLLAKDVDICRIGNKGDQNQIFEKYGWLIFTANEIGEVIKYNNMGHSGRSNLSVCQAITQMGEKIEEKIRNMWGIQVNLKGSL